MYCAQFCAVNAYFCHAGGIAVQHTTVKLWQLLFGVLQHTRCREEAALVAAQGLWCGVPAPLPSPETLPRFLHPAVLLPRLVCVQAAIRKHPLEGGLTLWTGLAVAYLLLFSAYWLAALVRSWIGSPTAAVCRSVHCDTHWRRYTPRFGTADEFHLPAALPVWAIACCHYFPTLPLLSTFWNPLRTSFSLPAYPVPSDPLLS